MAKLASAISGSLTMLDFIGNYAECQDFNPGDRLLEYLLTNVRLLLARSPS